MPSASWCGTKWGECRANTHNQDCSNKCPKGNNDNKSHVATVVDEAIVMAINDAGAFFCKCCVNEDLSTTHHFDDISFAIEQETKGDTFALDNSFSVLCKEACVNGEDSTSKTHLKIAQQSGLHSAGVMAVGAIQNVPCNQPLKVFDAGSNGTMANFGIIDERVHAQTLPGTKTTGMHGGQQLNQEILLEQSSFAEFSPTQRTPSLI